MSQAPKSPHRIISERLTQNCGQGDGASKHYSVHLQPPIVPGTVTVRAIAPDAVSQLAKVSGAAFGWAACHDINEDGVLYGDIQTGCVVYSTGAVSVNFNSAPPPDYVIEASWRREQTAYGDCRIKLERPDGGHVMLTLAELQEALNLL